jgi:hypothetical protein
LYNFEKELAKYGLTQEKYERLLKDCSNKVQHITDDDWSEICARYGLEFNPDTIRKGSQPPLIGSAFVSEYYKWKESQNNCDHNDKYVEELEIQRRELQKERNKLYATKTEYSRQVRQQSRFELFYENVANEVSLYEVPNFKYVDTSKHQNEYILSIADIHAGANFVTETNEYSLEEVTRRFEKLYSDVVNFVIDKKISNLKILCMGDDIQGILRLSDLQLNESSVVKATVFVAKTIARFLNDLSEYCFIDYYHCPTSNHSQTRPLGTKASEIASEDVEYVICNYIKDVLVNNSRITPHMNFGYEYIEIPVFDFKTIAMHGHTINNIDNALKDLTYHKKTFYTTVFLAHYHAAKMGTVGEMSDTDCEVIVCPSFVGSCPYSEKLMKGAKPSCCIYAYNEKYGHTETYKFILN